MDPTTLAKLLAAWGPGAALMLGFCAGLALWLGSKRLWVWGWTYQDVVEQRDHWHAAADNSTKAAEEQAQLLKEAVRMVQQQIDTFERRRDGSRP